MRNTIKGKSMQPIKTCITNNPNCRRAQRKKTKGMKGRHLGRPHPRSPTFSPKRLSLDDRIELELGVKKSPPQVPPQQISLYHQQQMYPCHQFPGYYTGEPHQPLHYGPPMQETHYGHPNVVGGPVTMNRRPPLLPVPQHIMPDMTLWESSEASMRIPSHPPLPPSQVVQVGNVLQVVPTDLPLSNLLLGTGPPPPPPPLPPQTVQKPPQTMVLQTGNMLQVIPSDMPQVAQPGAMPHTQKVVQIGNMLQVVPSSNLHPVAPTPPPPPTPKPVLTPVKPSPGRVAQPSPNFVTPVRQHLPVSPLLVPSHMNSPHNQALPPLPVPLPVPVPSYTSPPSPFLREAPVVTSAEIPRAPPDCSIPFLSPSSEAAQMSLAAEAERRREEREKRRQDKERKKQEKEKRRQKKIKMATENIIKKALQQEAEILDDSTDINLEEMRLIEEAMAEVPEEEEEEEEEEQPLDTATPTRHFKKKGTQVKIIRQINMQTDDDDEDEEEDDNSPPPPPPGSPPPATAYPTGYSAFSAPGYVFPQPASFTVLTGETSGVPSAGVPVYTPVYHQHHHTTTTTTTTVQFAPPLPPPTVQQSTPRKAK
uniref:Uncharacterized protein n=1 Tax=Timema shepardi TaxID=629360 RepID=A0A7R9G115_TIMSH|nr:unnamed protein product [Timema shepardi]